MKTVFNKSSLLKKLFLIFSFFLFNNKQILSQIINTEGLFDFKSIFQQKNIKISERIMKEWGMQDNFLQQIYYNANKDSNISSLQKIKRVFSIYYKNNRIQELVLLDDGRHFDNEANDGIFGNFLIGEFSQYRANELIINVEFDTIGISYSILYPEVNIFPKIPNILFPQNNSILSSSELEIIWEIDEKADGCGFILLQGSSIFGENIKNIILEKEYRGKNNRIFSERIPFRLFPNNEYTLIIWSYIDTKLDNKIWEQGTYSMEWCKFYIDTLSQSNHKSFISFQNFPNPFSTSTIIKYYLSERGKISIKIFDITGKEILTLKNQEELMSGEHYIYWDGKDNFGNKLASGVYLFKIEFNNNTIVHKMMLIR